MTTLRMYTFITTLFFIVQFLFISSITAADSQSSDIEQLHQLFKREKGLPYDTLPSTVCTVPASCSNISGGNNTSLNCRCNDMLNVCKNSSGAYCWGSVTLKQTTNCPAVPTSCSSTFEGQSTCNCNSNTVLCVDQRNNYCFATGGQNGGALSLAPIPTASSTTNNNNPNASPSTGTSAANSLSTSFLLASLLMIFGSLSLV